MAATTPADGPDYPKQTKEKKERTKKKMKKFNFAKIVSLVFVCAMLLCALAVTALAEDEPTVEIVSNNVFFGEKYQLMYAVNAPANAKVSATVNGKAVDVDLYETDPKDSDGNVVADYSYIIAEGVAAQAIDTVVTFTVEADGKTATSNYSVLQYVYERMYVKNIAEGKELAMFEAFLAFADAANANFSEGETVSFNNYKYVTVVNGTIDGAVSAGIYLDGSKPFANITTTVVAGENQNIQWTVTDEKGTLLGNYDEESIKDVEVKSHMILTAAAIDGEVEAITYSLLTDASMLAPGKTIVIVASGYDFAMSTEQKNNNRGQVAVEKNDGVISVVPADMQIITLQAGTKDGTYALYTSEKGYLYAASGSSNYLKSQTENDDNGSWKITIDDNGVASIVAQGTNSHNVMQYNQSSSLFACYESASQKSVSIYMLTSEMVVCEHTNTVSIPAVKADCTNTGLTEGAQCVDCEKIVTPQTVVDALGHTEETVTGYDATCAEDGLSDGKVCSVCTEVLDAQETLPATGEHNDGTGDGLCDGCNLNMTTDQAKADKILSEIQAPPANITEAGEIELDTTNNTGYEATITWSIEGGTNNISTLDGNKLTVVLDGTKTTIVLKVSVTVNETTVTKEYTINVEAKPVVADPVTKTLNTYGTNGTLASDSNSISWANGNVTVVNTKGSTAIRTSDSDHFRAYANSGIKISCNGSKIKTVVITATSSSYAEVIKTAFTSAGHTVSVSGSTVTITVNGDVNEISATVSAQTRFKSIAVTYLP